MISTRRKQTGFTIVELLIVIVVIGILAAITIVAYNGIQNRANDTAIRSDLSSMAKSLAMYHVDNGAFPVSATELNNMKTAGNYLLKASRDAYHEINSLIYCQKTGGQTYAMVARSRSGESYIVTGDDSSVRSFSGYAAGQAVVCPNAGMESTGQWGYASGIWQSWVS